MNIQVIDTFNQIKEYKENNPVFSIDAYKIYTKDISPALYKKCYDDAAEYSFERDVMPVLNSALYEHFERIEVAHNSITEISFFLPEKMSKILALNLDITIVFYLGLCNGAGWATTLDGKNTILLGAEKIAELNWQDKDTMFDLICHEAAHLIHYELRKDMPKPRKSIWQLYTEGFATRVSQLLYRENFYHQNQNGWLDFCMDNAKIIKNEYLKCLTKSENASCFFGDWNTFMGHSNIGYWLGCEFIRNLEKNYTIQEIALLSTDTIEKGLNLFLMEE